MQTQGFEFHKGVITPSLAEECRVQALHASESPDTNVQVDLELVDGKQVPARVERLMDDHEGAAWKIMEEARQVAEKATGISLVPLKDKLNFKSPGGGTFMAHQDTPAFVPHGSWHVSVLVPLTPFRLENGTLEVHPTMPQTPMEELAKLEFEAIEMDVGDCLVFDGFVPHRSGVNITDTPRAGYILTFTKADEGSKRDAYYAQKAQGYEGLSLNQVDFTGKLVRAM